MSRLSPVQKTALSIAAAGPLFRNRGGSWSRGGKAPFPNKTIEVLIEAGLVTRGRTTSGVPMVTITRAGCFVLDRPWNERAATVAAPVDAAGAAAARHERIAP